MWGTHTATLRICLRERTCLGARALTVGRTAEGDTTKADAGPASAATIVTTCLRLAMGREGRGPKCRANWPKMAALKDPHHGCIVCGGGGHVKGTCAVLGAALHRLFDEKADVVEEILRALCGWSYAEIPQTLTRSVVASYGPCGNVIAAGDAEGRLHLVCAQTGETILSHQIRVAGLNASQAASQAGAVLSVSFSPCEPKLAASTACGRVAIFSLETNDVIRILQCAAPCLAFKPDAPNILVSGSWDGAVSVWDDEMRDVSTMDGHDATVSCLAFKPGDPNTLVTSSHDKTLKLWDLATSVCLSTITGHTGGVMSVAWNHDGTKLASGGWDYAASRIWSIGSAGTFECQSMLTGQCSEYNPECTCEIGSESPDCDGPYHYENPDCQVSGHRNAVSCLAFKPGDPDILVTASWDKTLKMWDVSSGKCFSTMNRHRASIESVSWSLDGKWIASSSRDKSIRRWSSERMTAARACDAQR